MSTQQLLLKDEFRTQALGTAIFTALSADEGVHSRADSSASAPFVIYLHGQLGAGKSSLSRACLRAFGVQGAIKSPTYTLLESYQSSAGLLLHLDLYRIADPAELEYLGLDELFSEARLSLIEWPDRGGDQLPAADWECWMRYDDNDPNARWIDIHAMSDAGLRLLASLDVG